MKKILISLPIMLSLALLGLTTGWSESAQAYRYVVTCHKYCGVNRFGRVVCARRCATVPVYNYWRPYYYWRW